MWDPANTTTITATAYSNTAPVADADNGCASDVMVVPPTGPFPGLSTHEHHYKQRYVSRVKQQLQESFDESHPFKPFVAPHTQKLADAAIASAASSSSSSLAISVENKEVIRSDLKQ